MPSSMRRKPLCSPLGNRTSTLKPWIPIASAPSDNLNGLSMPRGSSALHACADSWRPIFLSCSSRFWNELVVRVSSISRMWPGEEVASVSSLCPSDRSVIQAPGPALLTTSCLCSGRSYLLRNVSTPRTARVAHLCLDVL